MTLHTINELLHAETCTVAVFMKIPCQCQVVLRALRVGRIVHPDALLVTRERIGGNCIFKRLDHRNEMKLLVSSRWQTGNKGH